MQEFISNSGGLVAAVVLIVISLNVALTGIGDGLKKIAEKTESKTDDAIAAKVSAVANLLKKVIEIISANKPNEKK